MAMISWSVQPSFRYAYFLAALMAPSTASAPELVKKTRSMPDTFLILRAASMAGTL